VIVAFLASTVIADGGKFANNMEMKA